MSEDALFPRTPNERLDVVAAFVSEERGHRIHMLTKYGIDADSRAYWQGRIAQCDEMLAHLAELAAVVP